MSNVTPAEQRVKLQIGELVVQLAMLSADNEAKDVRIKELEAKLPKEEAPESQQP